MKKASCNVLKLYHSVTHAFIMFDILIEMSLATANVDNILSRIFANIPRKNMIYGKGKSMETRSSLQRETACQSYREDRSASVNVPDVVKCQATRSKGVTPGEDPPVGGLVVQFVEQILLVWK